MNRDYATFNRESIDSSPMNPYESPMSFMHRITDILDVWRQKNNKKFTSAEIFREEFLKLTDELMMNDYQQNLAKLQNENKWDIEDMFNDLKMVMNINSDNLKDYMDKTLSPKKKK
jgi:hypothetical protein